MLNELFLAFEQRDYKKSIILATNILQNDSLNVKVWFVAAMSAYYLGDLNRCIDYLECAYMLDKHNEAVAINLAQMYSKNGLYNKSIEIYTSFLPSLNPDIYYNLGLIYAKNKDIPNAKIAYQKALSLNSNDTDAAYNLANIHTEEKNYKLALALYKKCKTIDALSNLARVYNLMGNEKEGVKTLEDMDSSLEIPESKKADFYFNYANVAKNALFYEKSKMLYEAALSIQRKPEYAINYAFLMLSLKEFKKGFALFEERLKLDKDDLESKKFFYDERFICGLEDYKNLDSSLTSPRKIREKLKNKKVLVFYEQGFGDSIMFARFIKLLESKKIFVFVQNNLKSLFLDSGFNVVDEDFNDFDYCVSLLSLPYILEINSIEEFNENESWLENLKSDFKIDSKLNIGIFFNSNAPFGAEKSIPPNMLIKNLSFLEATLHCLQPESIESFNLDSSKVKSYELKDFLDTARILKKLDALICIDSSVAHLGIALGIKTFVLVKKKYDWRWGQLGQDIFLGMSGGVVFAQLENDEWKAPLNSLKNSLKNGLDSAILNIATKALKK